MQLADKWEIAQVVRPGLSPSAIGEKIFGHTLNEKVGIFPQKEREFPNAVSLAQ